MRKLAIWCLYGKARLQFEIKTGIDKEHIQKIVFCHILAGFFILNDKMSKRFTVIEKWKDAWFQNLEPAEKLLFLYICDNCDCAGVWEINIKLAAFQIGAPPEELASTLKHLESRYIRHGEKLFVRNFLKHQGNLPFNLKNNAHKGIKIALESHNGLCDKLLEDETLDCEIKHLVSTLTGAS